jgi:hypothetical protein
MPLVNVLFCFIFTLLYQKSTYISHGFQIQFGANFYLTLIAKHKLYKNNPELQKKAVPVRKITGMDKKK